MTMLRTSATAPVWTFLPVLASEAGGPPMTMAPETKGEIMSEKIRFRYRDGKAEVYQNVYDPNAPASGNRKGQRGRTKMISLGRVPLTGEEAAAAALRQLLAHPQRGFSAAAIEAGVEAFREALPTLLRGNADADAATMVAAWKNRGTHRIYRRGDADQPDYPAQWETSVVEATEALVAALSFGNTAGFRLRHPPEMTKRLMRQLVTAVGLLAIVGQSPTFARYVRHLLPTLGTWCRHIQNFSAGPVPDAFNDPSDEGDKT